MNCLVLYYKDLLTALPTKWCPLGSFHLFSEKLTNQLWLNLHLQHNPCSLKWSWWKRYKIFTFLVYAAWNKFQYLQNYPNISGLFLFLEPNPRIARMQLLNRTMQTFSKFEWNLWPSCYYRQLAIKATTETRPPTYMSDYQWHLSYCCKCWVVRLFASVTENRLAVNWRISCSQYCVRNVIKSVQGNPKSLAHTARMACLKSKN